MTEPSPHIEQHPAPTSGEPQVTAVDAGPDGEAKKKTPLAREPSDLDPTRYGDWEKNGRCIDF